MLTKDWSVLWPGIAKRRHLDRVEIAVPLHEFALGQNTVCRGAVGVSYLEVLLSVGFCPRRRLYKRDVDRGQGFPDCRYTLCDREWRLIFIVKAVRFVDGQLNIYQ